MTDSISVTPSGPVDARVRPPGSKSITNRALVCAALTPGKSILQGALDSDDTRVMVAALRTLGLSVEHDVPHGTMTIEGIDPRLAHDAPAEFHEMAEIYIGNSGTTIRFLTSMLAFLPGTFRLHGKPRMHQRPIGDLVDSLRTLGADVACEKKAGYPPVRIHGRPMLTGKTAIAGHLSSQFLSGLLLAAPAARGDMEIDVVGELVSKPYIAMTLSVMRAFGAEVEAAEDLSHFRIPGHTFYQPTKYSIEPDASAASYFFAAAAITGGRVTVQGLSKNSLQGDVAFCDCLTKMGCEVEDREDSITVRGPQELRGIEVDMNAISDTVQTLCAVAPFAKGKTTIHNVAHIRHKETDRIAAMATELRKTGIEVKEFEDGITIHPGKMHPATFDTYDDHRMAMSLALLGLRQEGMLITEPDCTAKTYPDYFRDLQRIVRR